MSRQRLEAIGPDHRDGPPPISDTRAVLVIARNPARAGEIVGALQSRGMLAMQAVATREAFVWARTVPPRLVLLDLEIQGSQILLHEFRAQGRGVIALSDDADRRRAALEAGCLDALRYSDSATELALHVAAFLRRPGIPRVGRIACGPLDIDLANRRVHKNGTELQLSPRRFDFVAYNAARPAQLTPAVALLQDLWSEETDTRKVHLMAHRVRRRIGEPVDSKFFVGRRGYGYGFFPDSAATGSAGLGGSKPAGRSEERLRRLRPQANMGHAPQGAAPPSKSWIHDLTFLAWGEGTTLPDLVRTEATVPLGLLHAVGTLPT